MRRGSIFLFLALIIIVGLVVGYFFYNNFIAPPPSEVTVGPTPTPMITEEVVMVVQHVDVGGTITEDVVRLVPYPQELITSGMFRNIEDVLGMRAKVELEPQFILTQNMVTISQEDFLQSGSEDALLIPRGMVSVSIPIDRLSSVSYAPKRGDHVNVIVTLLLVELDSDFQTRLPNLTSDVLAAGPELEGRDNLTNISSPGSGPMGRSALDPAFESPFYVVPSEQQRPRMVSQTLIQDVIVLQMGDFPLEEEEPTPTPAPGEAPVAEEPPAEPTPPPTPPPPPDVITLIVSPQDAVTLNYLIYSGAQLTLAMRNPTDDQRVQTEAVTLQFLLDQYQIPIPAKLPYGLEPRVDSFDGSRLVSTPVPEE